LNPINKKRKWTEQGAPSKSVNQKKSTSGPPKSLPVGLAEPYEKCRKINHTTPECRAGTNKYKWCGSPEHLVAACPQRLKAVDRGSNLQGS